MTSEIVSQDIRSLLYADAFPHSVDHFDVLETHISWVVLTGPYAYKIKKPVDLGFVDFSTLELRKHYCEEEVRLNRHWAPDLYLGVVEIRGSELRPTIGGTGPLLDYAVKMTQFSQSARLDAQLVAGRVDDSDMRTLATMLAAKHRVADIKSVDINASIKTPMLDNFDTIAEYHDRDTLRYLRDWTNRELDRLQLVLATRIEDGYIRECHGDLHLANLVRLHSGIAAFDCVEFSARLRNIDVMSDVAFLVMDLVAHERSDLAYEFLNRYLELSGDYAGVSLLDLYFVYHCLIRAKIAAIRSHTRADRPSAETDERELLHELNVAREFISRPGARIIAMHGFSGSGKTTLSSQLVRSLPAIRIRSDVERKRLHGYSETERSNSDIGHGIYTRAASDTLHEHLADLATIVVNTGNSAIIDASFLKSTDRERFESLSERLGIPFLIVDTYASHSILFPRLQIRDENRNDASEASLDVLCHQISTTDPLNTRELRNTISVNTGCTINLVDIVSEIRDFAIS